MIGLLILIIGGVGTVKTDLGLDAYVSVGVIGFVFLILAIVFP